MSETLQTPEVALCVERVACDGAVLPEERRAGGRCEACMRKVMGDRYRAQKREMRSRGGGEGTLQVFGIAYVGKRARKEAQP